MKILHCVYSLNPEHGAPRDFVEQAAAQQSQHNFQLEVACLDQKTDPWVKKFSGAPVHALGPGLLKYGYTKKWKTWIEKHHAKYDVVVINGLWHFHSIGTWLALHNEEKPFFVMPHNHLDSWYAYRYPLQHFKNLIYWSLAEHRVLHDAKAVIFTSTEECNAARKAFTPYEVNEAVVSAGTTAPPDDNGKQVRVFFGQFGGLEGKEILLFLGKLNERKGLENLLEAFAARSNEKPNMQLVIAGAAADNYGMKLQEIVGGFDEKIRERVTFTGNLSGDTKWGALRAADALIVPAHQSAQARSVKEALSVGKPVLISSKMAIWADVAQHEAGLVEDPDVEGTTKLLERWFDVKPNERKTMGTNAKALFLKKFEDTKFFPKYLSVLEGKTPAKHHTST